MCGSWVFGLCIFYVLASSVSGSPVTVISNNDEMCAFSARFQANVCWAVAWLNVMNSAFLFCNCQKYFPLELEGGRGMVEDSRIVLRVSVTYSSSGYARSHRATRDNTPFVVVPRGLWTEVENFLNPVGYRRWKCFGGFIPFETESFENCQYN